MAPTHFERETPIEHLFNQLYGFLVRIGLGFGYNYLLQTRGRKSGRIYSTPVNVLELNQRRFLVASRGETGWVRNARAAGEVTLVKGSRRETCKVSELPVAERPPILKEFLERYSTTVQRFYPMRADSPLEAFREVAVKQPVFELIVESRQA